MISPIHPNKFPMTENIVDRDQLQQNLIDRIVDDMDLKTLMQLVAEQLDHNYDDYTVDQLIAEVEEYYPELLNDNDNDQIPDESTGWN
jgi:tetrahydromethanopterin S-methyltransferase subunit A